MNYLLAALPLMEVQPGMIAVRTNIRDSFAPSDFGYGFSGVQDQMWTVDATFISKYISLTAYYGLEYDRLYRENAGNLIGQYIKNFEGCSRDSEAWQALCEGVDALLANRR